MLSISVNFFDSTATKEAFFDSTTNKKAMRKKDCLAFIVFCAVRCNGSAVIAEIVRMMEDENLPWYQDFNSHYEVFSFFEENYYEVLCFLADQMFFGPPGCCTNPRHTYTNPDLLYDFEKHSEILLKDLKELGTTPANKLQAATKTLMTTIIKKNHVHYKGFGHVVAHDYIQMCSLLGLIPLKCYTFAAIVEGSSKNQTGPAKFIGKCFNVTELKKKKEVCDPKVIQTTTSKADNPDPPKLNLPCMPKNTKKKNTKSTVDSPRRRKSTKKKNPKPKTGSLMSRLLNIYDNLFSDVCGKYSKVWNSKFRKIWLENAFCELNRIVEASECFKTFEKNRKRFGTSIYFGPLDIKKCFETPLDLSKFVDDNGSKKDTIYLYRSRPFQRQIQPQFEIVSPYKKIPQLKMISHLITKDGEHKIESMELTSWTDSNPNKKQHMYWGADDRLVISSNLCNLYSVTMDEQCLTEPCDGECCVPLVYGESEGGPKVYSPVLVTPMQKIIQAKNPFDSTSSICVDFWKEKLKVPRHMPRGEIDSYFAAVGSRETETTDVKKDSMKSIRTALISEWNDIHEIHDKKKAKVG